MQIEQAFAFIDSQDGYLIDVMRQLLAVDTSVPPWGNYAAFCDVLEPLYRALGFECHRVVVPPEKAALVRPQVQGERINLVASRRSGKLPCSIYAHMDTVPPGDGWTYDPFGGQVDRGRIYGRGAVDMKGSIGALLLALQAMVRLGLEPRCDVLALMCTDEELGVYPGVRYLAEQGYVEGEVVWLEAGMQAPIQIQGTAGNVEVTIKAIGRACHSGMSYLGINAVEAMVPVMDELLRLKDRVEKRRSAIPLLPMGDATIRHMAPVFSLNVLHGGEKANIVPGECTLIVDRRYIPEERYEDVAAEIEEAVARGRSRSKALDWQVEIVHSYSPEAIDLTGPCARRVRRALQAVHGYGDDQFLVGGLSASTDLGFVTGIVGNCDVAGLGPLSPRNLTVHQPDEYAEIQDLKDMAKVLVHYLLVE